jgi:hypothetical protein
MANTKLIFLTNDEQNTELSTYVISESEISICIDIPNQYSGISVVFDKETAIEFLHYLDKQISYLKD